MCFIFNEKEEVLLVKHKKSDLWLPVGGHSEKGGNIKQSLDREILEEVNLQNVKYVCSPNIYNDSEMIRKLPLPFFMQNNVLKGKEELIKLKQLNPNILLFSSSIPSEIIALVNDLKELNLDWDVYDLSANLAHKETREQITHHPTNTYTLVFPFTLNAPNPFKQSHITLFQKEPLYSAVFGYDIIMLVHKANTLSKHISLTQNLHALQIFSGVNGEVIITNEGEINPKLYSLKIVNESLQAS